MKVIDLLNDLFDYREFQPDKLPKKIKFNNREFEFMQNSYYDKDGKNIMEYIYHTLDLRVEIEIIEEDKEIEHIYYVNLHTQDIHSLNDWVNEHFNEVYNKIYELIDEVNKRNNE